MKETIISTRNSISAFLYKNVAKPIFFRIDPEKIHDSMTTTGKFLGSNAITRQITKTFFGYKNKILEQEIKGIKFKNPIGLSAGFDKDADMTGIMGAVGFGFAEIGSVTGESCTGNPKPRLWRLKKSKGLVVYYGLKNIGCENVAKKLRGKKFDIPIGISVAKTNNKKTAQKTAGIKDYAKAFKELKDIGQYTTINISCPNAYGGQPFTNPDDLDDLMNTINKIPSKKPIFLKLSPDLTKKEIDKIIYVSKKHKIDGFICSNLVKNRTNTKVNKHIKDTNIPKKGGISGRPTREVSTDIIKYIYRKTKGEYTIIGCGGVSSAEDAYKKIKSGASLIQLITGMIFEGPQLISEINRGLVKLLKKDGYKNISEAIGTDA